MTRVLVVEDDQDTRSVLKLIFESRGYRVDCAADGWAGLIDIAARAPDLVILDLMLPGMDGWQVLDRIKMLPRRPAVVVLSAYLDRARAEAAGVQACIEKPFTSADLVAKCEQVLSGGSR
jgi:CheY-like chemotaxis protein